MTDQPSCGYCRECRWWEQHWLAPSSRSICELSRRNLIEQPFYPESLALSQAREGWSYLETLPEFGCVQFAPRPVEEKTAVCAGCGVVLAEDETKEGLCGPCHNVERGEVVPDDCPW